MEKIPTANELFEQYHGFEADSSSRDIISLMIEFAKLHVEQALKEASDKFDHYSNKNVILGSYSLDNIK